MPADPATPASLVTVFIIAITTLAGVIAYLFRYYSGRQATAEEQRLKREDEHAHERTAWALERAELKSYNDDLRAEYEAKFRAAVDRHAETVRALYDVGREHENAARREYLQNMEIVAAKAAEANDKIGAVLEKALERSLGARRAPTKD
jgi:biopolymer transport protein ExbB/TolQ